MHLKYALIGFFVPVLLALPTATYALSGSNTFICELIEYSEDADEVKAAVQEAQKRGICGFVAVESEQEVAEKAEAQNQRDAKARQERVSKGVFITALIVAASKGKVKGPVTSQPAK